MKLFFSVLLIGTLAFVEIHGYNEYERENDFDLDLDQEEDSYDLDDDLNAGKFWTGFKYIDNTCFSKRWYRDS